MKAINNKATQFDIKRKEVYFQSQQSNCWTLVHRHIQQCHTKQKRDEENISR